MSKWPNFFIVGAPRCGTTSLYRYLEQIPEVFISSVKEPNYFNPTVNLDSLLSKPIRDEKRYLDLFKDVKNEVAVGEASPTYLWDPKTPELIHKAIPNARIIIIMRDPIERAYSEYLFLSGTGSEKKSFNDIIRNATKTLNYSSRGVIETGLYYEQVKRYLDVFNSKKVKILFFEEFIQDTLNSVKEVLEFLGIQNAEPKSVNEIHNPFIMPRGKLTSGLVHNPVLRKLGKAVLPRKTIRNIRDVVTEKVPKPKMSSNDRKILLEFYQDDVKKLHELLGQNLPWFKDNYDSS